jgi:putative nucleotidyltransferase with HDIG domain
MDRAIAWSIMTEFTESESLRRHMLAVEFAMRAYAERFNADAELWGVTGLLHDFDYEKYPDVATEGHPVVGARILQERGVSDEIVQAILAHAEEITGVAPTTLMQKTLVAVDELTGFIIAVALVRPSKSLLDLEVSSIKKKWKDKAFAAPVDRSYIAQSAENLGVPLDEHIGIVLEAMRKNATILGMA